MQNGKADQTLFSLPNLLPLIPSLLHLVLEGFFSIPLTFSLTYAPAPRLVVYVIFPNGKIIADSAIFSVSACFRNKVGFVSGAVPECVSVDVSAATQGELCSCVRLVPCEMLSHDLQFVIGELCCDVWSKCVLSVVGAAAMFGKGRELLSVSIGNCSPVGSEIMQPSTGH